MLEFIDIFVKFSNFMSREWLPVLSRGEGFLYTIIVPGEGFAPFKSRQGRVVLDKIDTCIIAV